MTLPWFTTRRRAPVTCENCGVQLERVVPALPYYSLAIITGLLCQALPVMILLFVRRWDWIVLVVVVILAVNLLVSAWLNSRTRVEFADPADARQDKPGRWYPS